MSQSKGSVTSRLAAIHRRSSPTPSAASTFLPGQQMPAIVPASTPNRLTASQKLANLAQRNRNHLHPVNPVLQASLAEVMKPIGNEVAMSYTSNRSDCHSIPPNLNSQTTTEGSIVQQFSALRVTSPPTPSRRQGFRPNGERPVGEPEIYNCNYLRREGANLKNIQSSSLISSFNALAQNLFGGSSRNSTANSLSGSKQVKHQVLLEAHGVKVLGQMEEKILQSSPTDIRTVNRMFDSLDPKLTVYACCPDPTCSMIYPPKDHGNGMLEYPLRCNNIKYQNQSCHKLLVEKCGVVNGTSVPKPIKPYSYHHFNDHVASMLSRPGIEEAIENHMRSGTLESELTDIMSSRGLRDFQDNSGETFLRQNGTEIRLVWAFAADWFNPYSNKLSGKSVSTGVFAMICLSLPPHLRYLEENIYLSGLIPGPHEPSLDAVNHFMMPLMHDLAVAYESGTSFSYTFKYPTGRTSFSAVIPVIADTQASKKITGNCAHGSKYFCSRCRLPRTEIDNIDPQSWPPGLSRPQHEELANAWRMAPTKSKQKALVKSEGIRWSALLLLPYWQPSDWTVAEGLHVLLLGVVLRHCRDLLGLNCNDLPNQDLEIIEPIPEQVMQSARQTLAVGSPAQLHKLRIPILATLCKEGNILLPAPIKGRRCKKDFIAALLGQHSTNVNQGVHEDLGLVTLFDEILPNTIPGAVLPSSPPLPSKSEFNPSEINSAAITKQILGKMREFMDSTIRPSWQAPLPKNFGSPEHGKLKADQWRTALEFDIPVSLIRALHSRRPSGNVHNDARFHKIVENTLDLATALAWGLSRRTSDFHAGKYSFYMQRYLAGVQRLFPEYSLKPIHHYALHIPDMLTLFGPLHGTWAFVLERLIGRLQKMNTNHKIGEMEKTAMNAFCRRASLIRLIESRHCPVVLQKAWSNFKTRCNLGDLNNPATSLDPETRIPSERPQTGTGILAPDVAHKFVMGYRPQAITGVKVFFDETSVKIIHDYQHKGLHYTDFQTSERHSMIYYTQAQTSLSLGDHRDHPKDGSHMHPAQIRQFFYHMHLDGSRLVEETYAVVHRYIRARIPQDPFMAYPDFRAAIYLRNLDNNPQVIRASQIHCHANQGPWDEDHVVMRAIDREY